MRKSVTIYRICILLSCLFFLMVLNTCERDDICAESTETTPRLLIEFYDAADTETLKTVSRLSVYAVDLVTDGGVFTPPEVANDTTLVFNSNTSSVQLPLQFDESETSTTTRYYFETDTNLRIDDDTSTDSNIDILEITYTPEFIYVSRACGFKSIFTNLTVTELPGDDSIDWIQNTTFANTTDISITVENENTTHVQIFH